MKKRLYHIIGAYDTETTNICELRRKIAFPVLYQIGTLNPDVDYKNITPDNVKDKVNIELYNNQEAVISYFEEWFNNGLEDNCCYIFMVHNLSFDIWTLAPLLSTHEVRVCARSTQTPITVTLLDDNGEACLEFLDTLSLYGKSLAKLGKECKYDKLIGDWDYSKIRTPYTPLTLNEYAYAKRDIYVLFVYLAYWLKINPDIGPDMIGTKIVSKTGVVRQRRMKRFGYLKCAKRFRIKDYWQLQNKINKPKSNEELLTMHAATRGGFTFCANNHSGKVYDLEQSEKVVVGFDATSQHPTQMIIHFVPTNFQEASPEDLQTDFELIVNTPLQFVLDNFVKPFDCAFYGVFEFTGLKPKKDSVYEKNGIYSLADSRLKQTETFEDANSLYQFFENYRREHGYKDFACNADTAFGKIISADAITLYLTELEAWILSRIYDYTSITAIAGYDTLRFNRPMDLSVLSVMNFYQNKNLFKQEMKHFENGEPVKRLDFVPDYLMQGMINHDENIAGDMETYYFSLKADLNSLYGIEVTNEARPDIIITENGLTLKEFAGLSDMPKTPKTLYQYGQRIVGWSRIAQCVIMELAGKFDCDIINGDTDSIKLCIDSDKLQDLEQEFSQYGAAVDKAKDLIISRVKRLYPSIYDELKGIGYYEREFTCKQYYSAWNKAYIKKDSYGWDITLAGIPQNARSVDYETGKVYHDSLNDLAVFLEDSGANFSEICNNILGYNIYYDYTITKLNQRKLPEWNTSSEYTITDYTGATYTFTAPNVICLYPQIKIIGNTLNNKANAKNFEYAKRNNYKLSETCRIISFDTKVNTFRIDVI